MSKIIGINTRWYPVGGSQGMERAAVTVVLVAGEIGDYAAYCGVGGKEHAEDIARFGDKISFEEAVRQFPYGLRLLYAAPVRPSWWARWWAWWRWMTR